MISLPEAHSIIGEISPLDPVVSSLDACHGRVCSEDVYAEVDCPTADSSLKDGFAVVAEDIAKASRENPINLYVTDTLTAGDRAENVRVGRGEAVRIMTGAGIPEGASSVVASEFTKTDGSVVTVYADAWEGRNILRRGSDISRGDLVVKKGTLLRPAKLGLLGSAGVSELSCYPTPQVAVVATGSELVWPGEELSEGKVAASNMVTAHGELLALGCTVTRVIVRDDLGSLQEQLDKLVGKVDLLITCGGVLDGDKDLTMKAMEVLGMEKLFHRVRIGPGKGACLGRLGRTVVCNLPGGPPSNHVGLMLLALPVCKRLMGVVQCFPPKRKVVLEESLEGQLNWTQLFYSRIHYNGDCLAGSPLVGLGRLQAMGAANGLIELPEDVGAVESGEMVSAWIYSTGDLL